MSKKSYLSNFLDEWLTDPKFSSWIARASSKNNAKCTVCCIDLGLSTMGVCALESHASGKKHCDKISNKSKIDNSFFFKPKQQSSSNSISATTTSASAGCSKSKSQSLNTIESYVLPANAKTAEILWALKVVMTHASLRSCVDLNNLFKVMFSDSEIVKHFQLVKTKCGYLINYGISPFFKDELIKTIKSAPFLSVSFDESMNRVFQEEQMDVVIRFWDEINCMVKTRYINSQFLKRPNAENLLSELLAAIQDLPQEKMIQLSMDGPTTNWKILTLIQNHREEKEWSSIINIGSCGLHIVHGAFQTGASKSGWEIDKILKAMWQIFHDSPARRDVYIRINESDVFPLRIFIMVAITGATALIAAPFAVSLTLGALGFTSAGVLAGSVAAAYQSTIGNVVAGSAFAAAQSAGATGVAGATLAASGMTVSGVASGVASAIGASYTSGAATAISSLFHVFAVPYMCAVIGDWLYEL